MSFTHKITRQVEAGGTTIKQTESNTADAEDNRDISVPDGTTDLQVNIEIDVSALKSLYIESDQDVTIETNNAGPGSPLPADTLSLNANSPITWTPNSVHANPLTTDVTAMFITNSSGATATVRMRVAQDSTP